MLPRRHHPVFPKKRTASNKMYCQLLMNFRCSTPLWLPAPFWFRAVFQRALHLAHSPPPVLWHQKTVALPQCMFELL